MERQTGTSQINNAFYDELQDLWYTAHNHPVALLRAENKVRNPWIARTIAQRFLTPIKLLDIGCGAGLLTNALAQEGHCVTGIDLSEQSLKVAAAKDVTKKVTYLHANAYHLPFQDESFDVVCAMDILEHVENPEKLIKEASRVLKPGGLFFFHTFNRNLLSFILIIKGVDLFCQNAPKNMHVYPLFIKPKELETLCKKENLTVRDMRGLRPCFDLALFKMIRTRQVPENFAFRFSKNLATGYCGFANKI
jgi:2-polyprenyl-6-hydroxyphenyl methylase/3-demethylubiquinone-9 3-methyltransferase